MHKKTVSFALRDSVDTLDPVMAADETSGIILSLSHRRLYKVTPDGRIKADLVKSEKISGREVTLTLKKARFHDGRELSAADVVFVINRLRDSGRWQWILQYIEKARAAPAAEGPGQVILTLRENAEENPGLWNIQKARLTMSQLSVYSERAFRKSEKFVGAGAFKVIENTRERVRLSGRGSLPDLNLPVLRDATTRWFFFERDLLDIYEAIGVFRFMNYETEKYRVLDVPQLIVFYGAIVPAEGSILNDPDFRKALNYRFDRKSVAQNLLLGAFEPADYPVPTALGGRLDVYYKYDKDYPYKKRIKPETITIYAMTDRERQNVARAMVPLLESFGLKVKTVYHDLGTMIRYNNRRKPGIYLLKWVADYPHAENFLLPLFHSQSMGPGGNRAYFSDRQVDHYLDNMKYTPATIEKVQKMIRERAPWLFIGFSRQKYIMRKELDISLPVNYSGWGRDVFK